MLLHQWLGSAGQRNQRVGANVHGEQPVFALALHVAVLQLLVWGEGQAVDQDVKPSIPGLSDVVEDGVVALHVAGKHQLTANALGQVADPLFDPVSLEGER
jgi:hypothetical protein